MDNDMGFDGASPKDYLATHESDLLVDLPSYHKMNLDDVDVIERTVTRCNAISSYDPMGKWPQQEPEKVTDNCLAESDELELHNMIEEGVSAEEVPPEIRILMALDKLLKRIEIMQCDIRLRQQLEGNSDIQTTEDQATMQRDQQDMDQCLGFPSHLAELRKLQRAQHQQQCQIQELLCRYAHLRTQKRTLSRQLNLVQKTTLEIREMCREFYKWMEDTSHELGLCRQRSKQIRKIKLTKQRAKEVTEVNIWSSFRYSQRYLLRKLLNRHLNDLSDEIVELRRFTDELAAEVDHRLAWITKKAGQMGRLTAASNADDLAISEKPSILKLSTKYGSTHKENW